MLAILVNDLDAITDDLTLVLDDCVAGWRRCPTRYCETAPCCARRMPSPEGYVRVFVDEGTKLASLLKDLSGHGATSAYIRRLLAPTGGRAPVQMGLVEPLSGRELEVLRLLATELDGPGIARELVVSLNTVRTHTKNTYARLGVTNRRAAVRRAAELNLRAAGHPR